MRLRTWAGESRFAGRAHLTQIRKIAGWRAGWPRVGLEEGKEEKGRRLEPELQRLLPLRRFAVGFLGAADAFQVLQQDLQRRLGADAAAAAGHAVFGRPDLRIEVGNAVDHGAGTGAMMVAAGAASR